MRTIPFSWMMWGNEIHAREKLLFYFLFSYRSLPNTEFTEYWLQAATTTTTASDF